MQGKRGPELRAFGGLQNALTNAGRARRPLHTLRLCRGSRAERRVQGQARPAVWLYTLHAVPRCDMVCQRGLVATPRQPLCFSLTRSLPPFLAIEAGPEAAPSTSELHGLALPMRLLGATWGCLKIRTALPPTLEHTASPSHRPAPCQSCCPICYTSF